MIERFCTFVQQLNTMKKLVSFLFISSFIIIACNTTVKTELHGPQTIKGAVYGDSVLDNSIRDINEVQAMMQKSSFMKLKVKGIVDEVCEKKGCWLTMKLPNGESMRVTFKDYAFFVPKNIEGKEIIVEGDASVEELSIEDQRHFAEDGGATKAEIEKITAIKKVLAFKAKGVVIP